ncbi:MAG: hypothetical protein AB8B51_04210 [Sedimentitalea sp.]
MTDPNPTPFALPSDLDTVQLPVDARYITRDVGTLAQVRRDVNAVLQPLIETHFKAEPTKLVISMGRCRVGSTALTNLFGMAGHSSFFQPFKAILRQHLHGQNDTAHIAAMAQPGVVHAKEMLGPYTAAETLWSPFCDLIGLGFPPDRLSVVWLERDVMSSLASWLHHWGGVLDRDTLVRHFILSSLRAAQTAHDMEQAGVQVVAFNYDSIQTNPGAALSVLDALNIPHDLSVQDLAWGARGNLASAQSFITFVPEPADYGAVKVHSNLPKYAHVARDTAAVTAQERALLAEHGLFDIHAAHLARCVAAKAQPHNA